VGARFALDTAPVAPAPGVLAPLPGVDRLAAAGAPEAPSVVASITIDLTSWVDRLRARRLLAVIDDVHRFVVTLVASDGQIHTQTVSRADIDAGRLRLTFSALAVGPVTIRVTAEDIGGAVLSEANQQFTVRPGNNYLAPVSVALTPAGNGGHGGGGSGTLQEPPSPPAGPADLTVVIQPLAGFPSASVAPSFRSADLATSDGRKPMDGTSFALDWSPSGDLWLLRNASEFYSYWIWNMTPGPNYDQGSGELLLVGTDGTLHELHAGVNARGLAVAGDGTLWVAAWPKELRHLAADGTVLSTTPLTATVPYRGIAVDATQVWVATGNTVARYTFSGTLIGQTLLAGPASALVKDGVTGAVWALGGNRVVKIGATGSVQRTSAAIGPFAEYPYTRLAVAPDGHVWVTVNQAREVRKLKPDATLAAKAPLPAGPIEVAVAADGSPWVAVQEGEQGSQGPQHHQWYLWPKSLLRLRPGDGTVASAWALNDPTPALGVAADGAIWAAGFDLTKVIP
jgi:hypothetical protein